jgi:hypothetical protein
MVNRVRVLHSHQTGPSSPAALHCRSRQSSKVPAHVLAEVLVGFKSAPIQERVVIMSARIQPGNALQINLVYPRHVACVNDY